MKKIGTKNWGLIFCVLLVASVVAVSGCTGNDNFNQSSNSSSSSNSGSSDEKLQIVNHKMTQGSYGTYEVTGQAKNIGNTNLGYASIDVKFYDSQGNLLNSGLDNINNLGPGETWNFKALYTGEGKPASYKIAVGSSF